MLNELGSIVLEYLLLIMNVQCTLVKHSTSQSWLLAESFDIESEFLDGFEGVFSFLIACPKPSLYFFLLVDEQYFVFRIDIIFYFKVSVSILVNLQHLLVELELLTFAFNGESKQFVSHGLLGRPHQLLMAHAND